MSERPRVFYGWVVATALAVLASAQVGTSYSFGLYLRPMGEQFGFDRSALALAVTLNAILVGLLQPFAGLLADRFGPRRIAVTGAVVLGLAVFALSFAHSLPEIYLAYGLLGGIGMAMATRGVAAKIVGSWFVRHRGMAMSLSGGGALIAQLLIVPIATIVLGRTDWQTADRVVAGLILLVVVPVTWALVRNTPDEKRLGPDGDPPHPPAPSPAELARGDDGRSAPVGPAPLSTSGGEGRGVRPSPDGLTLRQAIRHLAFWQLAFGLVSCGVTMSFPYTHLMAYANDMGMSDMTASETIGLAGLLSLPGSLMLAFLGDRWGRHRMLAVAYALRSITYLILLRADQPAVMLAAGVTLGLSWGATVSLTAAIVPDLFGRRMLATIVTSMTMLMSVASGSYTYLAGLDYDVLGSYQVALGVAAALAALAFVGCWSIRVQKIDEGEAAIREIAASPSSIP